MLPCSTKGPIKGKTGSFGYVYTLFIEKTLCLKYKISSNNEIFALKRSFKRFGLR